MSNVKLNYLTPEEFKMSKDEVNMQVVLGLQSCKTKKDVSDLLDDIRAHERQNAQKEIEKVNLEANEVRNQACLKITQLNAKIEAAKPILDKIIAICQDRNDVTTCEECCDKKCCEEYDLNAILFPRKENQRLKPTACTYKKTVPNCDDIDCNDCPHVAKPEEENTTP